MEKNTKVTFICDSVENVKNLFPKGYFDYVFCNKVFHHFVLEKWKLTLKNMQTILGQLKDILKDNGKICILDIFYDGDLLDKYPSKMIYTLTTNKNPIIAKIFRKLGAKSSGVGVCFQSEKMWRSLIDKSGLQIKLLAHGEIFPMKLIKRIIFMCKKPIDDCIFILSKKE